jgi:hypothetical protein
LEDLCKKGDQQQDGGTAQYKNKDTAAAVHKSLLQRREFIFSDDVQ